MQLPFYKYQGTGNDFILVDNRNDHFNLSEKEIEALCHRRFGIGADGLMELKNEDGFDFKMVYYNADGKPGSMCGNGGRCITRFAADQGIDSNQFYFIASDGPHQSTLDADGTVRLQMKNVSGIEQTNTYTFLDTGSPHVVVPVTDLTAFDVVGSGKAIRYNERFKTAGTNVNFVEVIAPGQIFVRTYERGVEDETFSCGTGVTAAALMQAGPTNGAYEIAVKTLGGNLTISYLKTADGEFENIWLCGPAQKVFEGSLQIIE